MTVERPTIALGSDHAGVKLREAIALHLMRKYPIVDKGTFETDASTNIIDYTDFAEKVADEVASGQCQFGILICGTGNGMSIAANKIDGIRCAVCNDLKSVEWVRRHNDANILALGARILDDDVNVALSIVEIFLSTPFDDSASIGGKDGRHERRLRKIAALEKRRRIRPKQNPDDFCQGCPLCTPKPRK